MPLLDPARGRLALRLSATFAAVLLACLPAAGPVRAAAAINIQMSAAYQLVHLGDAAQLIVTVTNPGDVGLQGVQVTDDVCGELVFVGDDAGSDEVLGPPETWLFVCDFTVTAERGTLIHDVATATATPVGGGTAVTASGTFDIDVLHPAVQLEAFAAGQYVGDTVRYYFGVANLGDTPIQEISVTAAACVSAITGPTGDDGGDTILAVDMETWQYTCDGPVIGPTDTTFHVDATVRGRDDTGVFVEASAQADATVIHPSATLTPGPNPTTAHVGDTITFTVKLTNTGDSTLHSTITTGTECDGETTVFDPNDTFSATPGEVWTITCTHKVTESIGATVHNVFTFKSSDGGDRLLELSTSVDVAIVAFGATPGPTSTRRPTAAPSVAPSDSEIPASAGPSAGQTLAPAPSATTPPTGFSPAPSIEPAPTGSGESGLPILPIVIVIVVIGIAGGSWFAWQRRRTAPSTDTTV